ncbi:MAG: hypothetical protein JSV03_00555 [Planctomycetota bacterium]|nr:MAG: hypothetical protein JSV03_00555 [Planctomycetota bacterium]
MTSKERFYSAISYTGYDRPPTKYYARPEVTQLMLDHFGLDSEEKLLIKLGDDFRTVAPRYAGPELRTFEDGSWEEIWGERRINVSFQEGTYEEPIYSPYKDVEDVEELDKYRFPSPDWYDYSNIKSDCRRFKDYVVCAGGAHEPDFLNGIGRSRGVERTFMDVALEHPVFLSLVTKRFDFYYEVCKRTLEAAEGLIDVYCFGEDLGSQNGPIISPGSYDKLFASYMKRLFALAHKYGARTMMHCCGSCRNFIPRLIELGLDILEVVQVDTAHMDIEGLHRDFYKKIAFCGSISVQHTLPFGTVEEVVREVELRKKLFRDGGMIIAPTHNIQVGTPVENIEALYRAIGSLR